MVDWQSSARIDAQQPVGQQPWLLVVVMQKNCKTSGQGQPTDSRRGFDRRAVDNAAIDRIHGVGANIRGQLDATTINTIQRALVPQRGIWWW
jgi:hypothetical protein